MLLSHARRVPDSPGAGADQRPGQFAERVSYDMTDPDVLGRAAFSLIDHVAHAVCTDSDGNTHEGAGLLEHAVIGPHHPSGFSAWTDVLAAVTP